MSADSDSPSATAEGTTDQSVIAAFSGMQRASPAMLARRRRILHEARRMMAEGGAQAMGMRDLAEQSGVSLRTLYNAFGSKEALIAAAVRQYYDKFLHALADGRDPYSLDWVLGGIVATNLRNQQIRDYLAALVSLYFSSSGDPAIRVELRRTAAGFMMPWLEVTQARREIRAGADIVRAAGHVATLQYAINQEWLAGSIADDALVPAVLEAVLTYLAGLVRGAALRAVELELADLSQGGQRLARLIAAERQRIAAIIAAPDDRWPVDAAQP